MTHHSRVSILSLLRVVLDGLAAGARQNAISVIPKRDPVDSVSVSDVEDLGFPFSFAGEIPSDDQLQFAKTWSDLTHAIDDLVSRSEAIDVIESQTPRDVQEAMVRIEVLRHLVTRTGRRYAEATAEYTRLETLGARIRLEATARLQRDEWDENDPNIQIRKGMTYSQADKAASGDPTYTAHKDKTAAAAIAARDAEIAYQTAFAELQAAMKILDGISVTAAFPTAAFPLPNPGHTSSIPRFGIQTHTGGNYTR